MKKKIKLVSFSDFISRNIMLIFFALILWSINCSAQPYPLTHPTSDPSPWRGLYINKFVNQATPANEILGVSPRDIEALKFAKDNNFKRLDLTHLDEIFPGHLGDPTPSGNTYEDDLCSFMTAARETYCTEQISAVAAANNFFVEFNDWNTLHFTSPYDFSTSSIPGINTFGSAFSYVQNTYTPSDGSIALRSEMMKFFLRLLDYNYSHAPQGLGAVVHPCRFDNFTIEYEWWNTLDWDFIHDLLLDLNTLQFNTNHAFNIHLYTLIRDFTDIGGTPHSAQQIADFIDPLVDKIYLTDYPNTQQAGTSNVPEDFWNLNYFRWGMNAFGNNSTPNTIVTPLFNCLQNNEGIHDWLVDPTHPEHTLFTAEQRFWTDKSILTNSSLIGDNILTHGSYQWIYYTYFPMITSHWTYPYCSNNEVFYVQNQALACPATNTITACTGDNLLFKYISNYETNVTCEWNFGDGTPILTGVSPGDQSHIYLQPGTYTATCHLTFPSSLYPNSQSACEYIDFQRTVVVTGAGIAAAGPTTFCEGGSVQLTASTGTSYYWTTPSGSHSTSQVIIANESGNYIVAVANSGGCATSTPGINIIINPLPTPNVNSLTNVSCFSGNNGTATAVGVGGTPPYVSFAWNTIPVQNNAQATNLTIGTYICTVTDNKSCTGTVSATITQPTQINIAFQNNSNPCIGGSSGSVTAVASGGTSTYSYSWNTVPIQNSAQATGLTAGTYIVTVTDGNGCTVTASYTLTENLSCCGNFSTDLTQTIIDNLVSPFELTGQYNLNSNINITKDVTLKGCTLAIASGVTITVQPGKTLTITDKVSTPINIISWLYSCGDMWNGIVNNGGVVIVNNNSLIQDAISAIASANGNRIVVTGARFDKNWNDISLSNGSFPVSQTIIYGNLFDCSSLISKAPYSNHITRAHIQLDYVTDLVVGDATRNSNTFLKGAIGINANYTNMFVYHNDFNPQNGKSCAIRGKGAGEGKDGNMIVVGGAGTNELNTFANAGWGVQCNGVEKVNSYYNYFNNCHRGISLTTIRESVSNNNSINNFYNGIEIYDAIFPTPGDLCCPENHIVAYNNFNQGLAYGADLVNYGNTAIDIRNKIPQFTPVTVSTNSIWNSAIGIHFLNSNSSKAIDGNSYDSQIPFDQTTADHYGIWVQNSNRVTVIGNNITWSGPFASGSTSRDLLQNQKGIAVARSFKCVFEENAVRNFAAGFNIFDDCTNDNLYCNLMDNCYHGVFLDDQNPNNKITDQGVAVFNPNYDHDLSTSWHNRWKDNIDNKVDGLYNQSAFRWLYSDAPYDPEYDPSPSAFMVLPYPCLLSLSGCTTPTGFFDDEKRREAFGKAVGDSSEAEIDSVEYAHGDKAFFYKQAKDNPDYLNLGYPTDVLYQLKYNLIAQTNIGKFEDIKASLSSKEIQEAVNKLNSMQNLNSIDENNKFISGLIALGYDVDLDLDSDTVALVTAIALQHPFYGGEAVYMARAMLRIDVHDQMPIYRKGNRPKGNKSINNMVVVYPNPTTNSFTIFSNQLFNESELRMYNSYGEQIRFIELPEQQSIFNVSLEDLPSGIYSIKITSLNKLVIQEKLVLIK